MLSDSDLERLGDSGAKLEQVSGEAEQVTDDEAHPCPVDSGVGAEPLLIILPLLQGLAYGSAQFGIVAIQALGEDPEQDGHAQEGARNLNQREPFGMVTGDRHGALSVLRCAQGLRGLPHERCSVYVRK